MLRNHPAVAWCERQNTGAVKVDGRFIRYGWRGCSDLLGMLKDGRLLAVEVKAPKGQTRLKGFNEPRAATNQKNRTNGRGSALPGIPDAHVKPVFNAASAILAPA